jgi:hypothetical protein
MEVEIFVLKSNLIKKIKDNNFTNPTYILKFKLLELTIHG